MTRREETFDRGPSSNGNQKLKGWAVRQFYLPSLFYIELYFFGLDEIIPKMAKKKSKKELDKETLAQVKKEMAEPRRSNSVREQEGNQNASTDRAEGD